MPRSYKRTPAQQKAYQDSQKKQAEDLKRRKADAKALAASSRPKKVNVTRSKWTADY